MLSKKAFAAGITALASIWQRLSLVIEDKNVFEFWYNALSNIEDEQFVQAIKKIISTFKEQPTVADIHEIAIEFANPSLSPEEAWSVLYKDIRQKGWYHEPTYSDWKLEAAKNALGWENLCNMETTQVGVFRAQFMRIYDSLGNREKTAEIVQDKNIVELVNQLKAELAPQSKKALPEHDRK